MKVPSTAAKYSFMLYVQYVVDIQISISWSQYLLIFRHRLYLIPFILSFYAYMGMLFTVKL